MRKIIAIEGCDGTGKTTLAAAMLAELKARGVKALAIKRPDTTGKAYHLLRSGGLRSEVLAAMDEDCSLALQKAREWLEDGHAEVIIFDRHYLSAAVYQGGELWSAEHTRQRAKWGEPDAWVLCDATPLEIHRRLHARGDQDSAMSLDRIEAISRRYSDLMTMQSARTYLVRMPNQHEPSGVMVRPSDTNRAHWLPLAEGATTRAARLIVADLTGQ